MGRSRWARALITTHTLATVVAFVGWVVQRSHGRPATWLEVAFNVINIPVNYSAVASVVVGLAAVALVRRKRVGLLAAVAFQVVGIYLATAEALGFEAWEPLEPWRPTIMTRVLDFASIPAGFGMLWLLWWLRSEFPGRLRKGSWWQAAATLLVGFAATVAVAWGVAEATAPGGADMRTFGAILARAAGLGSRAQQAILDALPHWLPGTIGIMVSLSALAAVWVFLRSAHDPHSWELGQERRLRHLIARFGSDSLAYFATRRDKSAVFSPGGEAAVTYRVVQGVCIASGDPVGDPAHWPDAIGVWLAEVHTYGWLPAVMSASEQGAQAYVDAGLRVIRMGDEAVIDERRLAAARATDAQLRRAVRHVAAEGVTVEVRRQRQLSRDDLSEIDALAESWRRGRTERGFSMALGRNDDPSDGGIVHVLARGTDRRLVGLLSFVPWGTGGLSLDVMRRSPDAPHGITEAMVFGLMERARHIGVRQVSLNFCMFRGVFAESEKFGASNVERLGGSVLGFLDRFWQLERLYRANRQYDPAWVPRYFCYREAVSLPHVAIAAAMAEGFLPEPRLRGGRQPVLDDERARFVTADEEIDIEAAALAPALAADELHRLTKLQRLEAAGGEGYPAVSTPPEHTVRELAEGYWPQGDVVSVAGRVRRIRDHGGVAFVDLVDGAQEIQLRIERPDQLLDVVDIGDLIGVGGTLARSERGARVVDVASWGMLAKSLHRIRFDGWNDVAARAQNRSEDLLTRPRALEVLHVRSAVVDAVRTTLHREGFREMATPVLHQVHGGASARPFHTHLNAYHQDLSLRIAPELYLKRLLVAGSGPIFEVSRNFRNEGVDATHNPEFTSVEAYRPFADYDDMRVLTQHLVRDAARAATGGTVLELAGEAFDLDGEWPVIAVCDAVSAALGEVVAIDDAPDRLAALAEAVDVEVDPEWSAGRIIEELYGELVEPRTTAPTFYVDFPADTSPLTRPHRSLPGLVERWDLVVAGMEIGTAYTELTDPRIQRERLVRQSLAAAAGDVEAMEVDEAFLRALELGMPPSGGLGIGLDRLVMLLTGEQIRGVLSFPFTGPETGNRRQR